MKYYRNDHQKKILYLNVDSYGMQYVGHNRNTLTGEKRM